MLKHFNWALRLLGSSDACGVPSDKGLDRGLNDPCAFSVRWPFLFGIDEAEGLGR